MGKKETISVQGTEVAVLAHRQDDYISLTDMAKHKNAEIPATVISHWLSTRFSINYMGLWEKMNNPNFNLTGFREVKMLSAESGFALSPKQWIEKTNAIGIVSKAGRYGGGTFAHRNIAFEFASWLSPEFKYYLILNVALFGKTAAQWRKENPKTDGNIRDYATLEQLVVLSNMESINALLIRQNMSSQERIKQLNGVAILQMKSLLGNQNVKLLHSQPPPKTSLPLV
ncbi:MAG: KilA-N domain-containing protein [Fibromonadaceae bacterium]|jgi:hypothetical protein|nr:KilA-N domain-containing protein [Fibromonadaceae bacterium]